LKAGQIRSGGMDRRFASHHVSATSRGSRRENPTSDTLSSYADSLRWWMLLACPVTATIVGLDVGTHSATGRPRRDAAARESRLAACPATSCGAGGPGSTGKRGGRAHSAAPHWLQNFARRWGIVPLAGATIPTTGRYLRRRYSSP